MTLEVQLQYSDSMETDSGDLRQASAVFGHPFKEGHVMFGVDYSKQEETLQEDTDWDFMQHSYFIIDGPGFSKRGFVTPKKSPDKFTVVPVGSSRIPNGNFNLASRSGSLTLIDGRPGTSPSDFRPYNGDVFDPNNDTYNYAPVNYIQTPYERTNGFFEGSLELTDSRCPPWRAKRRRVVPGSREATRDTRRAEGAKGDPKGASERGVQSYGRPVCSRNELAMLWRNAG